MATFHLPLDLCEDLDGLVRRFWWESKSKATGYLALKSLNDICKPKELGGLGFRKFKDLNVALLAKLNWKLASGEECLWTRLMKVKYLKNDSFFSYKLKKGTSWVWKGIIKSRDALRTGACFRVGDGSSIDLWKDPWVPDLPNIFPSARNNSVTHQWRKVYEIWDYSNLRCKVDVVRQIFKPSSAEAILNLERPSSHCLDKLIWLGSKDGKFSVKSCYELLVGSSQT
nr:uncharacterized mitochondrial protein AtMg00310-like [Ziziphus jujuba var. spinosa]